MKTRQSKHRFSLGIRSDVRNKP